MSDYFSMGGYATYVWASWGLACAVLAWNAIMPRIQHRTILKDLAALRAANESDPNGERAP